MISLKAIVFSEVGLHARPASFLVQQTNAFRSRISIRKTSGGPEVNAKSIIHVLTLGVNKGEEVELIIDGEDEQNAAERLRCFFDSGLTDVEPSSG